MPNFVFVNFFSLRNPQYHKLLAPHLWIDPFWKSLSPSLGFPSHLPDTCFVSFLQLLRAIRSILLRSVCTILERPDLNEVADKPRLGFGRCTKGISFPCISLSRCSLELYPGNADPQWKGWIKTSLGLLKFQLKCSFLPHLDLFHKLVAQKLLYWALIQNNFLKNTN